MTTTCWQMRIQFGNPTTNVNSLTSQTRMGLGRRPTMTITAVRAKESTGVWGEVACNEQRALFEVVETIYIRNCF